MKLQRMLCLPAMLGLAAVAFAQAGSKPAAPAASPAASPAAATSPQAQPTPAPLTTIAAIADRQVSQYEKNVVEAAEAMPADKFDFSPASLNVPGAAYKDVRTFAQLIKHTATANYRFWTAVSGDKMPENIKGTNGPDELKTKAEIVQFLKDSFAVGHRAAKTLTPENAAEQIPFFNRTAARLYVVSGAVIHAADEYGQMVEYLRMNGIVPPASRGN
jgi:DinB superfamily